MSDIYLGSINYIRDISDNVINKERISIEKHSSKYSNTKTPIYKCIIDGIPISRNNSYYVNQTCISCHAVSEITLNIFARKINRDSRGCYYCMNNGEDKKNAHKTFMSIHAKDIWTHQYKNETPIVRVKDMTLQQRIELSISRFESEGDDYKTAYFSKHMTEDEFSALRPSIISIGNDKITSSYLSTLTYFPTFSINNQTKYTPILYDPITQQIVNIQYITYKCDNCDCHFTNRDLHIQKGNTRHYCRECTLTNKTFKIRYMKLSNGTKIRYQSVPEKRFITWCDENSIDVRNGPSIAYTWSEKDRKYYVDFELPAFKMLVELKDNHIWHKQQLQSGKWEHKETAATLWAQNMGYTYHLIFPRTISAFKASLLKI